MPFLAVIMQDAQIVMRLGEIGLHGHRAGKGCERLVRFTHCLQGAAQIKKRGGIGSIQRQHGAIGIYRILQLPLRTQHICKAETSLRQVAAQRQGLSVGGFRVRMCAASPPKGLPG